MVGEGRVRPRGLCRMGAAVAGRARAKESKRTEEPRRPNKESPRRDRASSPQQRAPRRNRERPAAKGRRAPLRRAAGSITLQAEDVVGVGVQQGAQVGEGIRRRHLLPPHIGGNALLRDVQPLRDLFLRHAALADVFGYFLLDLLARDRLHLAPTARLYNRRV